MYGDVEVHGTSHAASHAVTDSQSMDFGRVTVVQLSALVALEALEALEALYQHVEVVVLLVCCRSRGPLGAIFNGAKIFGRDGGARHHMTSDIFGLLRHPCDPSVQFVQSSRLSRFSGSALGDSDVRNQFSVPSVF